jgi:hypothetical protein
MAFLIRPDRADDSSAPISSAFREFSIYSLPELAGPAVATHLNSGFPKPLAPTGAASQSNQLPPVADLLRLSSRLFTFPLGSLWDQRAPTPNSEEP